MYKRRCNIVFFIFFSMLAVLLAWKIVQYQYFNSSELSTLAKNQYNYEEKTCDLNYKLLDCNGKDLLKYKTLYFAVIDPFIFTKYNMISDNEETLKLTYILKNYNSSYSLPNSTDTDFSKKIYFSVDETTYNKLKNIKSIKGFYCYSYLQVDRSEAWYIANMLTSIKRTGSDKKKDADSLEMFIYNKTKDNQYPGITFIRDNNEDITDSRIKDISRNINIKTTINKDFQDIIKNILNKNSYNKYKEIGVVLMEPGTGKIRAMVQKDDSMPNVNIGAATENGFQPGSIFKTIVEETGLQQSTIKPSDEFTCRFSKSSLCKEEIHGTMSIENAYINSCNNIFAQIGAKVGYSNFMKSAIEQGLYQKVLNLDSEVTGDFILPDLKAGGSRLISIGQNMRITPIQAVSISGTIINNGLYEKPQLLDSLVDNTGETSLIQSHEKSILNKNVSEIMKNQMEEVVKYGTGKSANLNGIEIGGKTGTSQRTDSGKNCSDGWFSGFFKSGDKYYSMVVFVKNIDIENESAGITAAPIFKDIANEVINYEKNR